MNNKITIIKNENSKKTIKSIPNYKNLDQITEEGKDLKLQKIKNSDWMLAWFKLWK